MCSSVRQSGQILVTLEAVVFARRSVSRVLSLHFADDGIDLRSVAVGFVPVLIRSIEILSDVGGSNSTYVRQFLA